VTRAAKPAPAPYDRVYIAGIALVAVLATLIWAASRWFPVLQLAWFDFCQILVPRTVATMPATVVEIDDQSIVRFGQWPWPRSRLAELLRLIERDKPLAIGVDILMPEPDRLSPDRWLASSGASDPILEERIRALPSSDTELARAIAAAPVIVGIAGTDDRTDREPMGPPFVIVDRASSSHPDAVPLSQIPNQVGALMNVQEIDRAATGHGAISVGPSERVIRRIPLVTRLHGRLVPSMPLEMLRVALGVADVRIYGRGDTVETIGLGNLVLPTEADGELRIYYSKHDPRRYVSAVDVFDGKVDPDSFPQKLVIVGAGGVGMVDYQNTPLSERMPGSEIHAQVLENLVDQTWLKRPSWALPLELAVFALFGLALVWTTPRWKPAHSALLATVATALVLALSFGVFVWRRLVFDGASPAVGLLVLFSALLLLTLSEAALQRRRLERVIQTQREQAAYISGELEAAKRIQTGYLPRPEALAGESRVQVAATMTPAREVGGDLYDFFKLDADRLFLLIGDVAGKGLSASMFMAVTKALYKSNALRGPNARVADLMRAANAEISRDNPEMFFVTAFVAVLDVKSGRLAYCNAGHDCPYVLGPAARELSRLDAEAGPPLCSVEGYAYRDAVEQLRPGQIICFTTDGVIDARDPHGERYGSARLQRLLAELGASDYSAHGVVDAISADVAAYAAGAEAADDLTVLAVRWRGPA
jgi:serine phosphatase RsbU (regulator of sigma subunit)/CHASE2 domain-containing sensor protein